MERLLEQADVACDELPFSYGRTSTACRLTPGVHLPMGMYAETASEVRLRWKDESIALENWDRACLAEWHATSSSVTR